MRDLVGSVRDMPKKCPRASDDPSLKRQDLTAFPNGCWRDPHLVQCAPAIPIKCFPPRATKQKSMHQSVGEQLGSVDASVHIVPVRSGRGSERLHFIVNLVITSQNILHATQWSNKLPVIYLHDQMGVRMNCRPLQAFELFSSTSANLAAQRTVSMGDQFLSSVGTGENCAVSMSVPNPSPVLDKDRAPMGLDILSSTGARVWRKAPKAFPDSSSALDKLQYAIEVHVSALWPKACWLVRS